MAVEIRILTGERRAAPLGQDIEIVFQVTADGTPWKDALVTIVSDHPDELTFEKGRPFARRRTGEGGVGTVRCRFVKQWEDDESDEPTATITFRTADNTETEMSLTCKDPEPIAQVPGGAIMQGPDGRLVVFTKDTPRPTAPLTFAPPIIVKL